MSRVLFLYSGEGTKHSESSFRLVKQTESWTKIEEYLHRELDIELETLWRDHIGSHRSPESPLLTVICEICQAELWKRWGYAPDVVLGHSIGELAAAYEAGFYSLEQILSLTYNIGGIASKLDGAMMHGTLPDGEIAEVDGTAVSVSSVNFVEGEEKHVTISGPKDDIEAFAAQHPDFVEMRPPHPWHNHAYSKYLDGFSSPNSKQGSKRFVSGVTGKFETELAGDYWKSWLSSSIDFVGSVESIEEWIGDEEIEVIELGFHPVLEQACHRFAKYRYASSMYRGEDPNSWILFQRSRLDASRFTTVLTSAVDKYMSGIDFATALAYQGFTSRSFVELTSVLEPLFPGLAPQDFYRYKSIDELIDRYGKPEQSRQAGTSTGGDRNDVVVAGMSCRFPASIETPHQFWETLVSREDQVRPDPSRGGFEAGFLDDSLTRFDHRYFGISDAEAKTMDPQQMLALELTEMLFRDSGIDPATLDKRRVGVYLGVWNEEFRGDRGSVYYPTGTNPSIIASRISYHYDFRGPSWVSNTACSSSLVAVHYACKDIEAGRVDYAIAGGVNMVLGNTFTDNMRGSGFLSIDQRCKAFDDSANGYVRSEGGGLVLLVNRALVDEYYATVNGSAINQNGGRPQVITAPHPEAQEEVILDACYDAGIEPSEIGYVECHGTGTKIGDPIEISALQNTIARDRETTCYIGSVKSNIGHLESAAGMAGLIKSILVLHHGKIPADLHFSKPNQYIDFASYHLEVVAEEKEIDHESYIGTSSFGFGGANAHVVIAGVDESLRKPIAEITSPFDRERARPLTEYYSLESGGERDEKASGDAEGAVEDVGRLVADTFLDVTGVSEIDPEIELTDQGLDSMGATQFVTTLQTSLGVELDTDLLFDYPLFDQLVGFLESQPGLDTPTQANPQMTSRSSVDNKLRKIFYEVTSIEEIDPSIELTDQGLDSMGATQFITQLQSEFKVELDTDILFDYPLADQLVDHICEALKIEEGVG